MKCSLDISNLLRRSLVFPILLLSSNSLHRSFKKAFLSLLAILWNSAFSQAYLSLSPCLSLLSSAICKAASDNHFAFLHFFFFGMVLVTASCMILTTSIHSYSGTLSTRSNSLTLLLLPLYNHKGFYLGHRVIALLLFPSCILDIFQPEGGLSSRVISFCLFILVMNHPFHESQPCCCEGACITQ